MQILIGEEQRGDSSNIHARTMLPDLGHNSVYLEAGGCHLTSKGMSAKGKRHRRTLNQPPAWDFRNAEAAERLDGRNLTICSSVCWGPGVVFCHGNHETVIRKEQSGHT